MKPSMKLRLLLQLMIIATTLNWMSISNNGQLNDEYSLDFEFNPIADHVFRGDTQNCVMCAKSIPICNCGEGEKCIISRQSCRSCPKAICVRKSTKNNL